MNQYKAKVFVSLKEGILDPQGKAVEHALSSLGFNSISDVRIGKMIELKIQGSDETQAEVELKKACEKLLANPVIEHYNLELVETNGATV